MFLESSFKDMAKIYKNIIDLVDDHSNDKDVISNCEYSKQKSQQLVEVLRLNGIRSELIDTRVSSNRTAFILRVFTSVTAGQLNRLRSTLQLQLSVNNLEIVSQPAEDFTIAVIISNPVRTVFSLWHAFTSPPEEGDDHPLLYFLGQDDYCCVVTDFLCESSPMLIGGSTGTGKSLFLQRAAAET